MQRRDFVRNALGVTAASYARVRGANERIRMGLIGAGLQGSIDWAQFLKQPDVEPAAVCDVFRPYLERGVAATGGRAKGYADFRKLLEQKDVDAVLVATPDHWHALPTMYACRAGKDVYVEKPLALTIREGRVMLNAARKYNRVVQVGSQQRSGAHYARAVELIRAGKLGTVAHISAAHLRNAMPGFGKYPDSTPPPGLDWDMWLGPAPYRPYNELRCLYNFRWFWDYSGGQMTNFGAHELDIARWMLDAKGPLMVAGVGGRFSIEDGGETPDVQDVIYRFPSAVVNWSLREMNGSNTSIFEVHGSKGTLRIDRKSFQVSPEFWGAKMRGRAAVAKQQQGEEIRDPGSELSTAHTRNFLDCVKSRKRPNADIEEGHRSAIVCHLGNIAMRLGRSLRWDAEKEQVVGDPEANGWLARPYRKPWKLEDV